MDHRHAMMSIPLSLTLGGAALRGRAQGHVEGGVGFAESLPTQLSSPSGSTKALGNSQ